MYTYKSRIRYSEIDEGGNLRLETLLDYFQDCSTFQSED
ncbi:MAG: acyl-[acyl-carrier-protein] thioesterase, partial [Suilimivivens sp.]